MTAKAVHVAKCTGMCSVVHTPVQAFHPFQEILPPALHMDLVGPLPTSKEGFTHLFTIVDRTTRWPEAILLKNTTLH